MDSRTALEGWLAHLPVDRLTALLEERALPQAAGYARVATFAELAGWLLADQSVLLGLSRVTAGEVGLLATVALRALEEHGPVAGARRPVPAWSTSVAAPVEPFERLVSERELLDSLAAGGLFREQAAEVLDGLRERALVLPAPDGRLAVPSLLHTNAAEWAGFGAPVDELMTAAFNAPEVKRVAAGLGLGEVRTRTEAQQGVAAVLGDPLRVRAMVADAPRDALDLLEHLVAGPPLMRTHCFEVIGGRYYGPGSKYTFRAAGSGDTGTDWLAARGMVVPVDHDLVELPYEVAQALRTDELVLPVALDPEPLTRTVELPRDAAGHGAVAAAAAVWRAELVLRELAARPVTVRKAGGIAVRDTRRLAKAAGASEEHTRLWLDLAVNAGLAAPHADSPEPTRSRRKGGRAPSPSAAVQLLPTERFDAWAAAAPAGKMLALVAAWAVVPEVFTYWPDDAGETPVALVSPQDGTAVPLRRGVLRALGTLPEGRGLAPGSEARAELLERAVWFQPLLGPSLLSSSVSDAAADASADEDGFAGRLQATLAEAELLGLVSGGALTAAGHAVGALLEAGAADHFPAVPGADADPGASGLDGLGADLERRPALARAVAGLRDALQSTLPAPSTTARFQSDLTATVTGAPAPELAELLSAVGDIESEGHAVVWRISPASLRRAYDAGRSADDVAERLTAVSANGLPLPQPLAYTIKDTARTHGKLKVVRSACCIRCDDPTLIAEVAGTRGLAKLGLRRIASTVLISTAPPDETLAALRGAGFAPVLEAETGTTVLERVPAQRAPSVLPSLDQAHPQYGTPARGIPSSARELAEQLTAKR
ncbi:helicase-associated domain-containing protein [Yinghuangia sp. YIM S09857]|uniref:helicase-associated domain-containing protein n=1 Tax=Yinghuangia sp. YIM S09857 TaxID=3436929 RepID=UPI003F52A97E